VAGVLDVAPWIRRPWDSEFFGVAIADVTPTPDRAALAAAVDAARLGAIDCLYLLLDAADSEAIAAAEDAGFSLVDVRLTMKRGAAAQPDAGEAVPPRESDAAGGTIRPARLDDIPALAALARVSHRNTRFHRDRRFDRSRSDELYAVWVSRSIAGELAHAVWVAEVDGAPRGYITVSKRESAAAIGLVAVAEDYRGRGFGDRLMQAALRWAADDNVPFLTVVTQGTSASSLRFYERAGFRASRIELWYHCWLDRGRP
jgi:dTDP-4-amino-4,6-dideoxy-D-galactose acyltransferase